MMTEDAGRPAAEATRHGRHRIRSGQQRTAVILALVVAIIAAAGLVTWLVRSPATVGGSSARGAAGTPAPASAGIGTGTVAPTATAGAADRTSQSACPLPGGSLTVAASPDIAPVLRELTGSQREPGIAGGCPVTVTPVDPATVLATGPAGANVWIPDSSMWVQRVAAAGTAASAASAASPIVATSPVVLALPTATANTVTATAGAPDLASILQSRLTATPIRVGLPDPQQSAAAVGAVLAAKAAVTGRSDARAALTWAVRSSPPGLPVRAGELLDRLADDPNTAVPVSEHAVVAHNGQTGARMVVAVYPSTGAVALDYPVVTLSTDPATVSAAADLTRLLVGAQGRATLLDAGFRAPDGSAGPHLGDNFGVDPARVVAAQLPASAVVDDAIRSVQVTNEPSRMLAVMDISGSMQSQVPGANGASRMDLAKEAATRGLGLYPADSEIGLWVFSTTLTPASDHRELIPVSTLGPDGQGGSGAQRLARALAGVQAIPDGGTGLYDTVLDAVRTMRAGWDPGRVNTVLILSDGMNDDANGISLDTLLSTLAAEQDPARPVPVISIAFGPDSDVQALGQISRATGGAAYESRDPRQIGEIFLDAVGQRLCRPTC